jgi:hypothetical protein
LFLLKEGAVFQNVRLRLIIGAIIGAVLGGIDGWFKGFFGHAGPIVAAVYSILGAIVGASTVSIAPEHRPRMVKWGVVGWCMGTLMGLLRAKGLGYTVAEGIDWMVLGLGFGLFYKSKVRWAKIGAAIGGGIGFHWGYGPICLWIWALSP